MTYVLDTSVVGRFGQPEVARRIAALGQRNCHLPTIVLLEMGLWARNGNEHHTVIDQLRTAYPVVAPSPWAHERALEIQGLLADRGEHRSARLADLLIAATAEQIHATLLHYDRDFDTVARATGLPCEWIAPPGSLDSPPQ